MKFQVLPTLLAAASVQGAVSQSYNLRSPRDLAETSPFRCFYECIKRGMKYEECEAYIRSVLGDDLSLSEIPNLEIEVNHPRPTSNPQSPYWRIGIPTNVHGDVMCNLNGSIIDYRKDWVTDEGTFKFPRVECAGLDANACCDKFKSEATKMNIPLVDSNGKCLSCWVHQEYLEPVISQASGNLAYINHEFQAGGECQAVELSQSKVQELDASVQQNLRRLANDIDAVRANGATCQALDALQKDLQFHTRGLTQAMSRVTDLLCGYCEAGGEFNPLPEGLDSELADIRKLILEMEVKSDVNKLVIYTDNQGYVLEPPKIGGSRETLDGDRDDPDCNEANGLPPKDDPPPGVADEYYAPQTPEVDPQEEEYYINKPPPGPMDVPQTCEAGDIMAHSQDTDSVCFECRRCLLKECEWDDGTWCRKLFLGKVTGNLNEWKACLFTNGGETFMDPSLASTGGQKDWCSCAAKCEWQCIQNTDVKYVSRPKDRQCNTQNLATQSDTGEFCNDCRLCLQEESKDWPYSSFCRKLILGERQGSDTTWQACLESSGQTRVLSPTSTGDGYRDSWAPFARKCDESCYKNMDSVTPPETPICSAADIASKAGDGQICENCKSCIKSRCTYWKSRCEELLSAPNGAGSPAEWTYCFEHCGSAAAPARGRSLMTDDGSGTERATWCSCARDCDNQCHHNIA